MMSEEEYNKMIQEREAYKQKMNQKRKQLNNDIVNLQRNIYFTSYRMANLHKTDDELNVNNIRTPADIYSFYDKEEQRLDSFLSRIKKKLFG